MNDEYQGWTNRETWATDLWLSNDEGLYNAVNELAEDVEDKWELADKIKEYVEDLEEMVLSGEAGEELRSMFNDIGSLWRVDWEEIAESWKE